MRASSAWLVGIGVLTFVLGPATARAQNGFAIGPRVSFTRGVDDAPDSGQRFSGGVIRLGGRYTALELAMDYRSGLTGDLTERIKDYPIQVSMLAYPVRGRVAPYLIGGIGWYSQRVQRLSGPGESATIVADDTTRTTGYHAGFGSDLRLHRHFGIYGDYRYTFLGFDNESTASHAPDKAPGLTAARIAPRLLSFPDRLKMTHQGTRITWGANFYF